MKDCEKIFIVCYIGIPDEMNNGEINDLLDNFMKSFTYDDTVNVICVPNRDGKNKVEIYNTKNRKGYFSLLLALFMRILKNQFKKTLKFV